MMMMMMIALAMRRLQIRQQHVVQQLFRSFSKPGPRWNLRKPQKISGRVVDLWTEFCPTCLPNTLTKVPGSIKNLRL